jgi:hypothetical protein
VIVKLLGRKIGYKALENQLKQMWVRRGVIQIVDLSHDFYLVTFTSSEDQYRAIAERPWMIYDHYLVVRPWSSNFDPANATVYKTAVWVRFSGLPIEYYDSRILHFIGNRIGKTVKVDKNTLLQERGKYARLCVEVDLSKPLLAMFELKGRHYKVKYEGQHMLCLACGRFNHFSDGCANKPKATGDVGGSGTNTGGDGGKQGESEEGPWIVVQKPRRARMVKEGMVEMSTGEEQQLTENHVTPVNMGSRFALLTAENAQDYEPSDNIGNSTNEGLVKSMQSLSNKNKREKNTEKSTNDHIKNSNNNNKVQKINATRVNFKEKKGATQGWRSDALANTLVTNEFENLLAKRL